MKVLALTGGVGGAKLAFGLSRVLGPRELAFAVNTGDDFSHLGLHISPDIDSLTYALAGENNNELGWGRRGETWQFIDTLAALGGEAWFRLGDKDLALHMQRTTLLREGASLTAATAQIGQALGIQHQILPMSNDPVRTMVATAEGELAFQHYFVKERCEPAVTGFRFAGIEDAQPNPHLLAWLEDCDGVVICPSNPYVSVDPVLHTPGLRIALAAKPVIAVSPIVGGLALKGPAAKMMAELRVPASPVSVAAYYGDLLDGFVLDTTDEESAADIACRTLVTDTIMIDDTVKVQLARACLDFLTHLNG
ncbi:MAG: 2-phospho-L-lactate transferase [Pseudomonadota bacterium]